MRTYYRGPDVLITDEAFVRRTAPQRTFVIRELRDVGIVRGALSASCRTAVQLTGGAVLLVGASWPILDTLATIVAAGLIIVVPGVASIACWRMRPRQWELRATYETRAVVLFASADVRTFNQIARALLRAIEDAAPPAASYELAGE